jgi:hypothetical protein
LVIGGPAKAGKFPGSLILVLPFMSVCHGFYLSLRLTIEYDYPVPCMWLPAHWVFLNKVHLHLNRAWRGVSYASHRCSCSDFYPEPQTPSGASADADCSLDVPHTPSGIEPEQEPELEHEHEPEEEIDGRPYALRLRQKIYYAIPSLEDKPKPPKSNAGRSGGPGRAGGLPWIMEAGMEGGQETKVEH